MKDRFKIFTTLISKISRAIKKIKAEEMASFNLKTVHVSCLYFLHTDLAKTATELTDICDEDKGAISRALNQLEKEGYLTTSSKTVKKYKSIINLTNKGHKLGEIITEKIDKYLDRASAGITEEERVQMYCTLSHISDNLQKINKGEL